MADVFEDHPDLPLHRARLFELIERTPFLDWQLLTKRPENVMHMVPAAWKAHGFPPQVWVGTSVEDDLRTYRLDHLVQIPARIRFISAEPLLERVDLGPWLRLANRDMVRNVAEANALGAFRDASAWAIHWVIVGGESGPGARPMEVEWARAVVQVCDEHGVACFVKQLGATNASSRADAKGEDIEQFPVDLRVRQFPGFRRPLPTGAAHV